MWTLTRVLSHMLLLLCGLKLMLAAEDHRLQSPQENRWAKEVRSASSLEEFLRLTNFPDWKLWKCRLKLKHLDSSQLMEYRAPSHRSTRYASASYSLEILKAIDDEWQKTQCMPRETCVDVAKELGTPTAMFFKPPCVSVFRCNGCCNKEGVTCRNTSSTYVNKTIFSVFPFKHGPEPVLVKVANHTECKCLEPPLIRRHTPTRRRNWCSRAGQSEDSHRLCDNGLIYDCMEDRCVPYPSRQPAPEVSPSVQNAHCEIDVDRCACIPREQRPT
ncbi:vascular endothelial growth factor D [Clupea harengus]|uniref:Vascular endothelial growth factor D n=1 Tax=Clupea harengus TaxID=7950 RepID=A0A6P8EVH0_CLUHA|nr:vascular endothelial growth factor D [Clupea harengus]